MFPIVADTSASPPERCRLLRLWLAAVVIAVVIGLWGLGAAGFWGVDEGRYAEIAREMVESGDWITPRLVYVKYFEKPPLLYWLTALSFKALGLSEFAGRLPVVLMGLLTLAAVGVLTGRRGPEPAGPVSVLVLSTCLLFFIMGRTLVTDMVLTAWYTVAMVCLFFAFGASRRRAGWWIVGLGLSLGLGFLAKGVVAVVLPLATGAAYAVVKRRVPPAPLWAVIGATAGFLVIVAPWFVLVSLRNPEFLHFFVVVQHLQRFLGGTSEHHKPCWFFGPITPAGLLPWVPALFKRRNSSLDAGVADLRLFLWLWAGVVVVFFSLSACKLVPYILPAIPALAALIAVNVTSPPEAGRVARRGIAGWASGLLVFLLGVAGFVYAYRQDELPFARVQPVAWLVLGACVVTMAAFFCWNLRRCSPWWLPLPAAATGILYLTLNAGAANLSPLIGHRAMSLKAVNEMRPGDVTVLFRWYDPGFVFYTRRRPVLFGVDNELAFGIAHQPMGRWFRQGDQAFIELMRGPRRVFCFTTQEGFEQAKKLVSPLYVVSRSSKRFLFSNRPSVQTVPPSRREPHR